MVLGGVLDVKAPFSFVLPNGIVKKTSSKFKNHKNLSRLRLLEPLLFTIRNFFAYYCSLE